MSDQQPVGPQWDAVREVLAVALTERARTDLDVEYHRAAVRFGSAWATAWHTAEHGSTPVHRALVEQATTLVGDVRGSGRPGDRAVWGAVLAVLLSGLVPDEVREVIATPFVRLTGPLPQ